MALSLNTSDALYSALTYLIAVDDDSTVKFIKGGITPTVGNKVTIQPDPGASGYGKAFRTGATRSDGINNLVTWATQSVSNNQPVSVFVAYNKFNSIDSLTSTGSIFTTDPAASTGNSVLTNLWIDNATKKFEPHTSASSRNASEITTQGSSAALNTTTKGSLGWCTNGGSSSAIALYVDGSRDSNFTTNKSNAAAQFGYISTTAKFCGVGGVVDNGSSINATSFDYVFIAIFVNTTLTDADFTRLHNSLSGGGAFALLNSPGNAAATVVTNPTNQTVNAGQTATFTASFTGGVPTPTYQWERSTNSGSTWSNVVGGTGSTSLSYTTDATSSSGGNANNGDMFRCKATNSSGSTVTTGATLSVTSVPVSISAHPSNQTITAGQTATFTVTATGAPSPTYQWQRSTNSGSSWSNVSTGTGSTTSSYTTAAASVSSGNANNGDQYRCVVTNASGSVNSNAATLTVNSSGDTNPPTMSGSITITNLGQTSWVATWPAASDDSGTVTGYDFSTDGGSTWTVTNWPAATYNFTGYTAGTTYNLVIRARDASNNVTPTGLALSKQVITLTSGGTFTSQPLKNNTGQLLSSKPLDYVRLYDSVSGNLILEKTGVSTNASGVITLTDSALTTGIVYKVDWKFTSTGETRMPSAAAT